MFKSEYDENESQRIQQLKAVWRQEGDLAFTHVNMNGVPIRNVEIIFTDDDPEVALYRAKSYAASFNEAWVLIEQTVEALSGV